MEGGRERVSEHVRGGREQETMKEEMSDGVSERQSE